MKKSVLAFFFVLVFGAMISFAQTVNVKTYGVSPRDVARDTVEQYFDKAYNSLQNVGKEVKVYLEGNSDLAFIKSNLGFFF